MPVNARFCFSCAHPARKTIPTAVVVGGRQLWVQFNIAKRAKGYIDAAEAYYNRGNVKAKNNDSDGAIADYTRAIELNPKHAHAYYNRGVTKSAKGDSAGAAKDFNRAKKIDPKLPVEK